MIFARIANDFSQAAEQAVEIHDMMRAMYIRFANDHGLEPFVPRITLTIPAFNAIPVVVFLVTGESKADAVRRAFAEQPSSETPSSLVRGAERTVALLDRPAAAYI